MPAWELIAAWEANGGTIRQLARRMARIAIGEDHEPTEKQVEAQRRKIQRWKTGNRPTGKSIPVLAEALGVDPSVMVGLKASSAADLERRLARLEIAVARIEQELFVSGGPLGP